MRPGLQRAAGEIQALVQGEGMVKLSSGTSASNPYISSQFLYQKVLVQMIQYPASEVTESGHYLNSARRALG
jgi:hypothetical protein